VYVLDQAAHSNGQDSICSYPFHIINANFLLRYFELTLVFPLTLLCIATTIVAANLGWPANQMRRRLVPLLLRTRVQHAGRAALSVRQREARCSADPCALW